jgi:hypothetical protein
MPEQHIQSAITLCGFALAHAAWSVSDGETLCTMAVTENQAERRLFRFESSSIPGSNEIARERLFGLQDRVDRWALVFDGYFTLRSERKDALIVQTWDKRGVTLSRIIQPYQAKAFFRRFKILGDPRFVDESGALVENADYQRWMVDGLQQHPKVAGLWNKWSLPA